MPPWPFDPLPQVHSVLTRGIRTHRLDGDSVAAEFTAYVSKLDSSDVTKALNRGKGPVPRVDKGKDPILTKRRLALRSELVECLGTKEKERQLAAMALANANHQEPKNFSCPAADATFAFVRERPRSRCPDSNARIRSYTSRWNHSRVPTSLMHFAFVGDSTLRDTMHQLLQDWYRLPAKPLAQKVMWHRHATLSVDIGVLGRRFVFQYVEGLFARTKSLPALGPCSAAAANTSSLAHRAQRAIAHALSLGTGGPATVVYGGTELVLPSPDLVDDIVRWLWTCVRANVSLIVRGIGPSHGLSPENARLKNERLRAAVARWASRGGAGSHTVHWWDAWRVLCDKRAVFDGTGCACHFARKAPYSSWSRIEGKDNAELVQQLGRLEPCLLPPTTAPNASVWARIGDLDVRVKT